MRQIKYHGYPKGAAFFKSYSIAYNNLICGCVQPCLQIKIKKMNAVNLKIREFIRYKLGIEESAITNGATFYGDLDVDSLDFCELIVDIEREFDITIPDDVYERFKTVGSLTDYVSSQVNRTKPKVSQMHILQKSA